MITRGGENICPVEVENVLAAHPDVRDATVFGAPVGRESSARQPRPPSDVR